MDQINMSSHRSFSGLYITQNGADAPTAENNGYYIGQVLEKIVEQVHYARLSSFTMTEKARIGLMKLSAKAQGQRYIGALDLHVIARRVAEVEQMAVDTEVDFVFSNIPSAVSGLKHIPYAFYSDAPFVGLQQLGMYMSSWSSKAVSNAIEMDKLAVLNAEFVVYHSDWAAQLAIEAYGISKDRVFVIPPGANIPYVNRDEVEIERESSELCRLLFFGRDWERKGGDIAVAVTQALNNAGVRARLTVCGPPDSSVVQNNSDLVDWIPPINKQVPQEFERMKRVFKQTDYLLLPTRADTSTSAIREAAAFAIPSITTNIGGLNELVEQNRSGYLLSLSDSPSQYADRILENWEDVRSRVSFRVEARNRYETKLNWNVVGAELAPLLWRYMSTGLASSAFLSGTTA